MTDLLLIRLENTSWYVLVDVEQEKIISQHNKGQVQADIAAIQETLTRFPDPTVAEQDLKDVIWLVDNFEGATLEHKDRVKKLLRDMWSTYEQDASMIERVELAARLEREQTLLAKMV